MKFKISLTLIGASLVGLATLVFYYHVPWSDLATLTFYENLANPSVRIVQIPAGLRQEQVDETLADTLGWSTTEQNEFLNAHLALGKPSLEGYLFPGTYLINKNDSPIDVTKTMVAKLQTETKNIPKTKATKIINQDTALKVASIIQREAAGPQDMRLISGIIWNRIFKGMKLQIDATVQYALGAPSDWWPIVTADNKDVNSPYNTYIAPSLPPTPIANPGLAAIEAAYNPQPTSCLFYLHDTHRMIHCSATYQGQLNNISKYY